MISLGQLVREAHAALVDPVDTRALNKDCFAEAKQTRNDASKKACLVPSRNSRIGAARMTYRRVVHVLNKAGHLKEMATSPAVRVCWHLRTMMVPVELGRAGEREKAYIFKFDMRLAHTRLALMDMVDSEECEEVLMDSSTQFFNRQSSRIHQWATEDMLAKAGATAMHGDLAAIDAHYAKVNDNEALFPAAMAGVPQPGSSAHNEASRLSGQCGGGADADAVDNGGSDAEADKEMENV